MSENSQCCENNITSSCCNCGDCCLIHEQFELYETVAPSISPTVIYWANQYSPGCMPSGGTTTGHVLPFGTIIITNLSNVGFELTIRVSDFLIKTIQVPAMGKVATTSMGIRTVQVEPNISQISILLKFDVFFVPPAPV